jgi:hypothetical protein
MNSLSRSLSQPATGHADHHTAACAPDRRPVAPYKGIEGGFVSVFDEVAEQFPVGWYGGVLLMHNTQKMLDRILRDDWPSTQLSSACWEFICRRAAI